MHGLHRRIGRISHDNEMRSGVEVPVDREQVCGSVKSQLTGAAGKRPRQLFAPLVPAGISGNLVQPKLNTFRARYPNVNVTL